MRKNTRRSWAVLVLVLSALITALAYSSIARAGAPDPSVKPVRELFVPYTDLEPLLRNQPQRMMLSRKEYDELLAKARQAPPDGPAAKAVLSSADYQGTVEAGQARFLATMTVTLLDDELHAVPLLFSGVGVLKAEIDGSPAPLGYGPDGKLRLFVQGRGPRRFSAELLVPLTTTAARQSLKFEIPVPPGTRVRLSVPGDVELKAGAAVVDRRFDEMAGSTRFELLPQGGAVELQLSLNSKLLKRDRVVAAHGVLIDEVTGAYERLHANFSFDVLHGSANSYRFQLPEGFDVTTVACPQMASWRVAAEGGKSILEVQLRDATTETVAVNIGAERTAKAGEQWSLARIEPLDVVRRDLVIGVLLEERYELEQMNSQGLIALSTQDLAGGLAASMLQSSPGAPRIRAVAAWYAPLTDYQLAARFRRPDAQTSVVTSLLLTLSDKGQDVRGEFAVQPAVEKIFALDFTSPADWTIQTVSDSGGQKLKFEVAPPAAVGAPARVHVRLPRGIAVGEVFKVQFHAVNVPTGWLQSWQTRDVACPVFTLVGAKNDQGMLAIKAEDDIVVEPGKTEGLNPVYTDQKARFGLERLDAQVALAYRQQPYSAAVKLRRPSPWVTARGYQFFRVTPEAVYVSYELHYTISEGRTSTLSFSLPESTPLAIKIVGLDGVGIKDRRSETKAGRRRWTVELAERRLGPVRLAVELQEKLADKTDTQLTPPVVVAEGVAYQSGIVAVEGHPELDVKVAPDTAREVDVGELAAAAHATGPQLLGAYAFVGQPPAVGLTIARRQDFAIPTSLVEKATLVTAISAGGTSQTAATFALRTKDNYLHIELPPNSVLWSVMIGNVPGRPQRDAGGVLVTLPAHRDAEVQNLRIAYETPVGALNLSGQIALPAPRLRMRDSQEEVPVADVKWSVRIPDGYAIVDSSGTVHTAELAHDEPLKMLGGALYEFGGGVFEVVPIALPLMLVPGGRAPSNLAPTSAALPQLEVRDGSDSMFGREAKGGLFAAGEDAPAEAAPDAIPRPAANPTPPPPAAAAPPLAKKPVPTLPSSSQTTTGGSTSGGTKPGGSTGKRAKLDAWEGHSSLDIQLKVDVEALARGARVEAATFTSLGDHPQLDIRVVDTRRVGFGAWGVGLLVGLVGILLTGRPSRTKVIYVLSVILLSILLPLVLPATLVLANAFNAAFIAGCLLVIYYLVVGFGRWLFRLTRPVSRRPVSMAATAVVLGIVAMLAQAAQAAEPYRASGGDAPGDRPAIHVPEDVIVVPYDPSQAGGIETATAKADRLLVPLARYTELWNKVHPDQKLQTAPQPAEYAIASAAFEATLVDADTLQLAGHIDIDLFVDRPVEIPFALSGVVLSRAEIEGKPARMRVVQAVPAPNARASVPQAAQAVALRPADGLAVLQLEGKGRSRLALELAIPIRKSGGWRNVLGKIPAGPATLLRLRVPDKGTEVCTACGPVNEQRETTRDNEQRDVAIAADGTVDLRWRGHVDDAKADPTLTVESNVLADVREDAWRVAWHANLQFARQQRDVFELTVPADYLVERVLGGNVRGWEVTKAGPRQRIDVTLLAAATGQESVTVLLSRTPPVSKPEAARFEVPKVEVIGANLHRGTLTIRRSLLLSVQLADSTGLQQVPLPGNVGPLAAAMPDSTLNIRPLAAYRFGDTSFAAGLSVRPLAEELSATLQTLVRLEAPDVEVASHIIFRSLERPVHRVRIALPAGLSAPSVTSPTGILHSVAQENGRDVLTVYFLSGQLGQFTLDIAGRIKDAVVDNRAPLPQVQVLDVKQQQGQIAVETPHGFEVRPQNLAGCQPLLLSEINSWLDAAHRPLARVALSYRAPVHTGSLILEALAPHVRAVTVTNVRYTTNAIEQTVHLQFDVQNAGLRRLSFLLPEALKQARIASDRPLRQKTVQAAADRAGMVRFSLEFQELQMGQVIVVATYDQLLTSEERPAPIPVVETGKTAYRYVALENSGRDEVVVEKKQNIEPLSRRQSAAQALTAILGVNVGQAFVVQEGAGEPQLTLKTTTRQAEQSAQARIHLAETKMVVDANGAYRAEQVFFIDNHTKQSFTIELPADARLWTVRVAGALVKPIRDPAAGSRRVQIPLVRTQQGDRDYRVEIKYGGLLPAFAAGGAPLPGRTVEFPLAQSTDIKVEQSQMQLWLPQTHDWFDFGGTATKVESGAVLEAGRQKYAAEELKRITEATRGENLYSQSRGYNALNQFQSEIQKELEVAARGQESGVKAAELNKQLLQVQEAQRSLREATEGLSKATAADNRYSLNKQLSVGNVNPAAADLPKLSGNFKTPPSDVGGQGQGSFGFNEGWYRRNGLAEPSKPLSKEEGQDINQSPARWDEQRSGGRLTLGSQFQSGAGPGHGKGQPAIQQGGQAGQTYTEDFFQRQQKPDPQSGSNGYPSGEKKQKPSEEPRPRDEAETMDDLAMKYRQRLARQGEAGRDEKDLSGDGAFPADDGDIRLGPGQAGLGGHGFGGGGGAGGKNAGTLQTAQVDTGKFSLDVALPQRGAQYFFTGVQNENLITARVISRPLRDRLLSLGWIALALLICGLIYRGLRRARLGAAATGTVATLLIVGGGLAAVIGFLPIYGLLAVVVGIVALVRSLRQRKLAA